MSKLRALIFSTRGLRWAGTLVSSALFVWLLAQQDWPKVWHSLRQAPLWFFVLVFALDFGAILINALRWYILLRTQDIYFSYSKVLKIVLSGNFASNFLPSTVGGDTVRLVSTSHSAGWSAGLASVVVDRLINAAAMIALLPFSWFSLQAVGGLSAWWVAPRYLAGGIFGLGEQAWKNISRKLWKIRMAFGIWRHRLDILFLSLLLSWAARLMVFWGLWLLAQGLGIDVNLPQVIGVGVITYLLSLLPISINGFGLREVTMTTLYVKLGASLEQASALVVVTRFILMLETLPGAIWIADILRADDKKSTLIPDEILTNSG